MTPGLFITDSQGRLILGPGTQNVNVLGTITTGKSNGSVTNPALAEGVPVVVNALPTESVSNGFYVPHIWFSGTTMYWQWKHNGANYNLSHAITYAIHA